jgi:hypothetical protein
MLPCFWFYWGVKNKWPKSPLSLSQVRPSLIRLSTTWRLLLALQLNRNLALRLNTTTKLTNVTHTSALSLNAQSKAIAKLTTLILWHLDDFDAWDCCCSVYDLLLGSSILNTLVGVVFLGPQTPCSRWRASTKFAQNPSASDFSLLLLF